MIVRSTVVITGLFFGVDRVLSYLFPAFARFLPPHHDGRIAIRPLLSGSEDQKVRLSNLPRPASRTHEKNVSDGKISEQSSLATTNRNHPSKKNGRKGVDVFSRYLSYWDRYV